MEVLAGYCREKGMALETHPGLMAEGQWISTSRVRQHLERGEIQAATRLLGSAPELTGKVVGGAQRGRTLGFPTANLDSPDQMAPACGIYAARALLPGEKEFAAAVHIGPNPTFGETTPKVEAHLLDFQGDLYGKTIRLEFLDRLREPKKFESVEQLKRQLDQDVALTRDRYGNRRPPNTEDSAHGRRIIANR